jgi:hypothetical protein
MIVASDFLKKGKRGSSKDNDLLFDKSNAATIGMVIGGLGGLYVGYTRNYNLLLSVFIGGLAGNFLTKALIKPKKDDEE